MGFYGSVVGLRHASYYWFFMAYLQITC